jgi:hypothetical protein
MVLLERLVVPPLLQLVLHVRLPAAAEEPRVELRVPGHVVARLPYAHVKPHACCSRRMIEAQKSSQNLRASTGSSAPV